uniref:carbohydrate-binding protein n=1 Tax=Francisella tularensis TaxID=263 RepID=UPI00355B6C89
MWRVTGDQGNNDQGNNDQSGDNSSTVSTWNPQTVYTKGDEVTYNGQKYVAQWWTQGNNPADGGAWKKPFVSGEAWSQGQAYTGGQVVTYQGAKYKAKWWTQGDIPSNSNVWEKQ